MAGSSLVTARRHPKGHFEGRRKRGSGRRGEILAGFLQSDVQADLATARAFLDEIAATQRGEKPQSGGVGNAFYVAIAPDGAVIRNAVLEGSEPERYSLNELQAALEMWVAAIERAGRR
jgi:hypothetical protein